MEPPEDEKIQFRIEFIRVVESIDMKFLSVDPKRDEK